METKETLEVTNNPRPLRDFIRIVIAYFGCLVVLSVYHHIRLYSGGVVDSVINGSFFLLVIHHIGFTAITALFISFLYSFLENRKPGFGFSVSKYFFIGLFVLEAILVEFYVVEYEILSYQILDRIFYAFGPLQLGIYALVFSTMVMVLFPVLYKYTARGYKLITRMYPFTFIIFTFFLATLITAKKPVNENKIQHLITSGVKQYLQVSEYNGSEEYPLFDKEVTDNSLYPYFKNSKGKPNILIIVVEGLSTQFIGPAAPYREFMPFLNELQKESLFYKNHLSNGAEGHHALPSILGSLPFGESGFTEANPSPGRNTMLSILKDNGYQTAYFYGGNSALHQVDKFLFEEKTDQIIDIKSFGESYKKQEPDRAGVSLGYPDTELFRKYEEAREKTGKPRLEIIHTLSTKRPYAIPDEDVFQDEVKRILGKSSLDNRYRKIVRKNRDVFASFLFADKALNDFFNSLNTKDQLSNTIVLITGSHKVEGLPHLDNLDRYRVPLLIKSSLINNPQIIDDLVSHADIAPSVLGLVNKFQTLRLPSGSAWIGEGLRGRPEKEIPLIRYRNGFKDYVLGNTYKSGSRYYTISVNAGLKEVDDEVLIDRVDNALDFFRSVNRYTTEHNKILPEEHSLVLMKKGLSKEEIIWVNSVFSGSDYDKAYGIARKLAFDGERDRALLLCEYILMNVPGHVDTEILRGRIFAWDKQFSRAERVLKECIRKYPHYTDSYAALLDVYYWSGTNQKALFVERELKNRKIDDLRLQDKIERAKRQLRSSKTKDKREDILSDVRPVITDIHFEDL